MEVYIFTRAYVACDEPLEITDTQTFTTIQEAQCYMHKCAEDLRNDPDDDWHVGEWEMSVYASCNEYEDEIAMRITKCKI